MSWDEVWISGQLIGSMGAGRSWAMPFADSRRLTAEGAKNMLAAAIAAADQFDISATVAIVDAGGHLMVLERMEGGRFHTVHSSTVKAVCAASNRRPTTTHIAPRS